MGTQDPEEGYGQIDKLKSLVRLRKSAYDQTFGGHGAPKQVLRDLARFCRANKTTFHANDRVAAHLEGRREVWLYIQEHLNLSAEEIFELTMERKK
jgi:glycine/D-amino acid oxidase-like deaminating enzyme